MNLKIAVTMEWAVISLAQSLKLIINKINFALQASINTY
jgi:hypothetical protein